MRNSGEEEKEEKKKEAMRNSGEHKETIHKQLNSIREYKGTMKQ